MRQLSGHLLAGLRKVALIGRGGDPLGFPVIADDVTDADRAASWESAAREAEDAWSDPEILARPLRLPWGTLPGTAAATVFTTEFTLHTWDLAKAVGLRPAWDPEVAGGIAGRDGAGPAGRTARRPGAVRCRGGDGRGCRGHRPARVLVRPEAVTAPTDATARRRRR